MQFGIPGSPNIHFDDLENIDTFVDTNSEYKGNFWFKFEYKVRKLTLILRKQLIIIY